MMDVRRWLDSIGLGQYADAFEDDAVDWELLPDLTEEHLERLGVAAMGHRMRILKGIATLATDSPPAPPVVSTDPSSVREAERRQLTVMFCDLVGSTALSTQMDPEELRDVISAYQDACRHAISPYNGFIARYMGDGLLVYFGYPRAHEDDPERAVRAGLDIIEAVKALETRERLDLRVRIGVATGLVVAGDIVGEGASEEQAVLGETPNLAARLQGMAEPNSVVLADSTRRLVGTRFVLEALEPRLLKGFETPLRAYEASAVRETSRFEATVAGGLSQIVGRDTELALLEHRWERASRGEGQVVLLAGEPGIGKSRITAELSARIGLNAKHHLNYECSPYHTGSAFYPAIEQLQRAAGFTRNDSVEVRQEKLDTLVERSLPDVQVAAPLLAALLSLPFTHYPALQMTPQRQKADTIAVLVQLLGRLAAEGPLLILFEDAHWIDPSTQELLGAAIDRLQSMPVLLLITYRPEFSPPWAGFGHVTTHSLNRLGGHETVGIIDSVTGGKTLPAGVVDQIIGKTDGVPLFVEEVTKAVLESGTLAQRGDSYILDGPLSSVMVPATLRDALLARLDRLPEAKAIAQTAACIGRVFSYEVLAAISRLDENDLREALSRLVNSELVFQRGVPPESIYTFKHALVRDTAYSSLMKVNRRRIHERLAEALEQRFQSLVAQHPEVLAHHLEQAEFTERAVKYWHQAGMQAAGRSAHAEAVTHLTRGLQLLSRLPDTEERIFQEVRLQNSLGVSLVTSAPSEEVLKAYTRARDLCIQIGESSHLYTAIWGLWYYNVKRMQLETARDLSYELIELAEQSGDRELLLQGHHSAWTVLLYLGDLEACEQHATEGRQIYDPEEHRHHALLYGGHDPGVCSCYQSSISHWLLGYPDQAVERVEEAIQLARRLEQPYSEVIALSASAYIHQFRGDPARVRQAVEATLAVGQGQGFGQHRETGQFFSGWATAMEGEVESGLETMRTSLAELKKMGANIRRTYYLSMFAELCILARRYCEAQNALAEADTLVDDFGERWWQPELFRLRGEASLATGEASKVNDAEAWLHRSRDLARQQSAKSLELRAVLSLAKLRTRQGRREEARALVEPLVESFTEGFGTTDLAKAGEALLELS